VETPEKAYSAEIVGCGIHAANPHDPRTGVSYVVCATSSTDVEIRTTKGELIDSIDTKAGHHNYLTISPDGLLIAVCGGVGDAKVYSAPRSVGGKATKAFHCGQHRSEVYHLAFSADATLCATVSKDGTWKVWDITIDWDRGGDPKLVAEGQYTVHEGSAFVALSPDNRVVAVASGRTLSMFAVRNGVGKVIEETHPHAKVTGLAFDSESKYVATCGTDKAIVIWHNTVGHEEKAFHYSQELLRAPNDTARERIQLELDSARDALAAASAPK
jgi:WD40 repeat protein